LPQQKDQPSPLSTGLEQEGRQLNTPWSSQANFPTDKLD